MVVTFAGRVGEPAPWLAGEKHTFAGFCFKNKSLILPKYAEDLSSPQFWANMLWKRQKAFFFFLALFNHEIKPPAAPSMTSQYTGHLFKHCGVEGLIEGGLPRRICLRY